MRKFCFNCNCKYEATRSDQMFCSKRCRQKYYSNPFTIIVSESVLNKISSGLQTEVYVKHSNYWTKRFFKYFGKYYDYTSNGTPILVWNKHAKDIRFCTIKDRQNFVGTTCTLLEGRGIVEYGAEPYTEYYILKIEYVH